jgi:hypothetical protein
LRQAPAPLQKPSFPQLAAPASVHWFCGSCPAGTLLHVPSDPVTAHDRHSPVQAVWQQTPCAQTLELHSASPPHAVPTAFLPQLVPLQTFGEAQSAVVPQVVRHAVDEPQTYGLHDVLVAA